MVPSPLVVVSCPAMMRMIHLGDDLRHREGGLPVDARLDHGRGQVVSRVLPSLLDHRLAVTLERHDAARVLDLLVLGLLPSEDEHVIVGPGLQLVVIGPRRAH